MAEPTYAWIRAVRVASMALWRVPMDELPNIVRTEMLLAAMDAVPEGKKATMSGVTQQEWIRMYKAAKRVGSIVARAIEEQVKRREERFKPLHVEPDIGGEG